MRVTEAMELCPNVAPNNPTLSLCSGEHASKMAEIAIVAFQLTLT